MRAIDVPIDYEDNHLLVVIKPPGLPTQADQSGACDLLTYLKDDLKQRHNKPGNVFLGLVHRLDRPVGGVMVFAKTSKAASRLAAQIRERTFGKTYLAEVTGCPETETGRLEHYLVKEARTNTVQVVASAVPHAKWACLEYQVLAQREQTALVRIELLTGRPHQIRVQLAAIGHPLVGDRKYGSESTGTAGRDIALRSHEIRFQHPTTQEPLTFTAPDVPWGAP